MNLDEIKKRSGYTSLTYYEEAAIADYEILIDTEELVLLKKDRHIHFYAESMEAFVLALKTYKDIEIHFVPDEWVDYLRVNGYHIIADFREFRCDLPSYNTSIEYLQVDDIKKALTIAKACENTSRGYKNHTLEFYKTWLEGTEINLQNLDLKAHAILKYGQPIQGTVAVAVYNQTLWVRDIAVHPDFQKTGVGTKLMAMAFKYGKNNQAKKAYLMADKKNRPGIKLYRKFGFKATEDSEIQMGKKTLSALKVYMNHKVHVTMDRPLGSKHPKFDMVYPINYGYLENTVSGDYDPIDAYVLDADQPLDTYEGNVIAIVFREDDLEDKLIVANKSYSKEEIYEKVKFTEQYFKSSILMFEE